MKYDAIVIGNGPSGISAAIYIKRNGFNPLIISKYDSSLLKAEMIENFYGFEEPISGKDLYDRGIRQAENLGIDMKEEEVVGINFLDDYEVYTPGNTYNAKCVVIATGSKRNVPVLKGKETFNERGISYCAICDAFFYRKKKVAVLGNGEYALHEASVLGNVTQDIFVVSDGKELTCDFPYPCITKKIKEVQGTDKIEKIIFEDGEELLIDGLFIALGTASSGDLAKKLGAEITDNHIKTNENMETNLPGLFACGDTLGGLLQVNKAAYEGAKAGISASRYLKSLKK